MAKEPFGSTKMVTFVRRVVGGVQRAVSWCGVPVRRAGPQVAAKGRMNTSRLSGPHPFDYIKDLVARGGPSEEEYSELNAWLDDAAAEMASGRMSSADIIGLRAAFGESFSERTMQGIAFQKPRGYAGDFLTIDRIYRGYVCSAPELTRWDLFWQSHPAANAVRNRKAYFQELVIDTATDNPGCKILNLGSGPGRDLADVLIEHPSLLVQVDCVDIDADALRYADALCRGDPRVRYVCGNALKIPPPTTGGYDLIWSAGLFDYFANPVFLRLLKRLTSWAAPQGRIVIGNFAIDNPSRAYMRVFDWELYHRSPTMLLELARQATSSKEWTSWVDREPLGVNLFLQLSRSRQ